MTETIKKFQYLLNVGFEYISQTSELELSKKLSQEKWSKKEILGHLIDSGINNLQRFTEIQFENKPYTIRKYKQNELVIANDYQNSSSKEFVGLWLAINNQLLNIINLQTEETLNYKILLDNGTISDLRFLIEDYVNHLEHHLNQIME